MTDYTEADLTQAREWLADKRGVYIRAQALARLLASYGQEREDKGRRAGLEEAADLLRKRHREGSETDHWFGYSDFKARELRRRRQAIKRLEKAIRALADQPQPAPAEDTND